MSRQQPLVTIAIPTYNRAATYLPQALACALGQTYQNLDIVVSDNCSTDGTSDLVARHQDSRVRYYRHTTPMRPNDNFNFCLTQARGDYFLLLLDDERVDNDFVATCMEAADYRRDVGLVRTGLRVIDANGAVISELLNDAGQLPLGDFFLSWFDGRTSLYLCNTIFQTAALRAICGFQSRHKLFQDVMAQAKVAARAGRVDVRAVKASTRSHPGQFTYGAKVSEWSEDSLDLLRLLEDLAPDKYALIRMNGTRFFAHICYSRASAIKPPLARLRAYAIVYRMFDHRCLPRLRTVLGSTALYRVLRTVKRRIKRQPSWAAAG